MGAPAHGPAALLRAAQPVSGAPLRALLEEQRHSPRLPLPGALARLLTGRRLLRMQLGLSYRRDADREAFSWWLGEAGFAGAPDAVREHIAQAFQGWKAQSQEDPPRMVFTSTGPAVEHRVEIDGPHPWTGGRETASGIRLRWETSRKARGLPPPLAGLLRELPMLDDKRVDRPLLRDLAPLPVREVSIGGTWTRYYSWDAVLVPPDGLDGDVLRGKLRDLLLARGFVSSGRQEDHETFSRSSSGSYATLYDPEKDGSVRLSIQPES